MITPVFLELRHSGVCHVIDRFDIDGEAAIEVLFGYLKYRLVAMAHPALLTTISKRPKALVVLSIAA